jgi:hypothetical protein
MSVKNLFKALIKKLKTKLKKKKENDVRLEYLQICDDLRKNGMVSVRELRCMSFTSEDEDEIEY